MADYLRTHSGRNRNDLGDFLNNDLCRAIAAVFRVWDRSKVRARGCLPSIVVNCKSGTPIP